MTWAEGLSSAYFETLIPIGNPPPTDRWFQVVVTMAGEQATLLENIPSDTPEGYLPEATAVAIIQRLQNLIAPRMEALEKRIKELEFNAIYQPQAQDVDERPSRKIRRA